MTLLLSMLVFITVVFLIWGINLVFTGKEEEVSKRLQSYTTLGEDGGWVESANLQKKGHGRKSLFLEKIKTRLEQKNWSQKLELELQKAGMPLKGSEMALVILGFLFVGIFLGVLVLRGLLGLLLGGLIGYLIPYVFIRIQQRKRLARFNKQINDCLTLISNSLKAGYSFFQAVELVSKEMADPIAPEFGRVLKEMNLGASTEEALQDMVKRVGSGDLDMVVQAVLIQRQVGGNLAEVLDKIGFTIRERIRIKAEIKTITAQGRMSGFIIALLPVGLAFLLTMMNPTYFSLLWTTMIGRVMVAFAVILEILGIMMIRKIVNIRI